MKTKIKILAVLFSLTLVSTSYSQILFVDNFNYPVCDSLEGIGGWNQSGGESPYDIKITSPGLTYAGYACSGIANGVTIPVHDDGDICLHEFNSVTSGSIYMSFMFRVESLSAGSTSGFVVSFDEAGGATNINTRFYLKRLTSSTFNFGISKIYTPTYSPTSFSINTTYLVVTKYTFSPGVNNDSVRMYVFSSGVPGAEPSVPAAVNADGNDVSNIGEVAITNTYAASGLEGSLVKIDGMKVGKTWNSTLFSNVNYQLQLTALLEGFYNSSSQKMIKDSASVIARYNFSPYMAVDSTKSILDSTGRGNFIFHQIQNYQYYYLIFKHRNSIETWTALPLNFYNENRSYDFTPIYNTAYGDNLKQIGQKYCIYGGDVNQDGSVDLTDLVKIFNDAGLFKSGYVATDVTGDNFVDLSDLTLAANNAHNFISRITP